MIYDVDVQPPTGATKVGAADAGVGKIGSGCLYVGDVLRGSCSGGPVVWVRDVADVPAHWEDLW